MANGKLWAGRSPSLSWAIMNDIEANPRFAIDWEAVAATVRRKRKATIQNEDKQLPRGKREEDEDLMVKLSANYESILRNGILPNLT